MAYVSCLFSFFKFVFAERNFVNKRDEDIFRKHFVRTIIVGNIFLRKRLKVKFEVNS